jgi:hypothetical protein
VQRYCNRVGLVRVDDDQITLRGSYGPELALPLGPVHEVTAVAVEGQAVDGWELVKDILLRTGQDDIDYPLGHPFRRVGHWGGNDVEVAVTYSHGDAAPDEAKGVCLDLAARVWSNPSGARSFSIDGYSAAWSTGSTSGLTDDDKATLAAWHRSSATADIS